MKSVVEYPFADMPNPGEILKINDEIFWIRMPLPFALDHINLWLIKNHDGYAFIDSGFNNFETKENWNSIFNKITNFNRLIITHYHPDHIGNASWLADKFGLTSEISQTEYLTAHAQYQESSGFGKDSIYKFFKSHGLIGDGLEHFANTKSKYKNSVEAPPSKFNRIIEGVNLKINNKDWKLISGYGHSPEHISLYDKDLNVLISGDMLLPKISTNVSVWPNDPNGNPLELFLKSITKFNELPDDTLVLPSHGFPFKGIKNRVEQLKNHHQERLDDVMSYDKSSFRAYDLLKVLFHRELDNHQLFFAMGEAIAHINFLWHAGKIYREVKDGNYYFSK